MVDPREGPCCLFCVVWIHKTGRKDPHCIPFLDEAESPGVFRFVFEVTCHLTLTLQNALLFKEFICMMVGNVGTLVLLLAHEEGVQGVLIDIAKCTTKGSFRDSIASKKLFDLKRGRIQK